MNMSLFNVVLVLVLFLLLHSSQPCKGGRVLGDKEQSLVIHSLQRGSVDQPGASGCTFIPGTGGSGCQINEVHFAGIRHPVGAYPRLMIPFGVASDPLLSDTKS